MITTEELTVQTTSGTDIIDITERVARFVAATGCQQGQVLVFTPGSTAAITTIEFESGVVEDLREAIARLVPEERTYRHDARWGDGNGYAHVRSALLGGSFTVPIVGGQMALGTWQQVVLADFDNRARKRRVILQVVGE